MSEMAGSFRFLLALAIILCFSTTGALTDCSGDGTWGPWQAWSSCSSNSQVRYRDCNPLPAGCIASAPFVCLRAVVDQLDVVVDAAVCNDAPDKRFLVGGHFDVHAAHLDFDIDQHINFDAEHEHKYNDAQHDNNNSEHNSLDNNVDKYFNFDNHNEYNDKHLDDHNSTADHVAAVGIGRCLLVGSSFVDHRPSAFHHLPPALHLSAAFYDRRIHRLHAARDDHRPHNYCIHRARRYHSVHVARSDHSVHHTPSNHCFYDSCADHRLHHSSPNHGVHHSACHDSVYNSCSNDGHNGVDGLDSANNDYRLDEHGGCDDHHRFHEHDDAVDDYSTTTTRPTSSTAAAVASSSVAASSTAAAVSSTAAAVASTTIVPPSTTFFASTTSFLSTLRATLPGGSNLPVTQCDYGQWGAWSSCSTPTYSATPCGMCGAQQRFRSCPTTGNCTCTGEAFEKIACGTPVCLYPAPAPCCTGFRPDGGNNQMACVNATAGR